MKENWYIILELEFDPNPVEDHGIIEQRIAEKAKFWTSRFNDFKKGAEYRKYHQMLPDIRKTMSDPEERKRLIKEACEITYAPIDKLLKMVGRKGEITSDELQKIAERQKIDVAIVERRRAALGIKKGANKEADFQGIYDKYYKNKPQNAVKFDLMKPSLATFGVDNLYDFLFANTPIKNANKLPYDSLRQKATERKKSEFNKTDSISGTGSKLCGECELTFKDDGSKRIYDDYLEYIRRKAILDEARTIANISGELLEEDAKAFIGQLTELSKDRKLAKELLIAFCKIEKILYHPKETVDNTKKLVVCRDCGCTNDVADGRTAKVCQNCGEELYIKCPAPNCEMINEATVKVCKCGFKFENLDKALALCNLAEGAMGAVEFAVAEAHLLEAERYWPGSSKVEVLKKQLATLAQRLKPIAELMRIAIAERRYFEAKKHYMNIQKLFPDFKDLDLEKEIQTVIDSAAIAFKQAQNTKVEKDMIDLCVKAYELCKDYPGVRELIPPPLAPTNLNVTSDEKTKTNYLSWDSSTSVGIVFYIIMRKKDAVPVNINDGELLGSVSACGFNDRKIEPATSYFYAVFAERVGMQSKLLINHSPVVNLFEITNLSITAGDSLLQLEWDTIPVGSVAQIYRKNHMGVDEQLTSITTLSYLDSGLINDTTYDYTVKLAYNVNGRQRITHGVSISGIPTKPPQPIESLKIESRDEAHFTATWSNPDHAIVELYCSTEKPTYQVGEFVSQQSIEKQMRRLALNRLNSTTATFQYKGDELLYIIAVVIKSGSVICGSVARASKDESVKITKIAAVNDKLNIYLDAIPQGVTGFVVLYRFDKFPEDISDVKTVRKYIPLKQYQHYSAIVLDTLESKTYYFSVFAEFLRDGEKDYSNGTDYVFSNALKQNISYSITVSKKLFGEHFIILEFEADHKTFNLPALEIMSAIGNTPMFKASAKPFSSIEAQTVNGSIQVKIPLPKGLQKDTYIKAFLKDDSFALTHQLKLKLKSNYKIS